MKRRRGRPISRAAKRREFRKRNPWSFAMRMAEDRQRAVAKIPMETWFRRVTLRLAGREA